MFRTLALALLLPLLLVQLPGCTSFTLSDVTTSVQAGRTFEDGGVFAHGKTAWGATVTGRFTRDRP